MATMNLLLLPGDGIGPEVMAEVKKLIAWMNAHSMGRFATEEALVGGCCYDAHKVAITDATMDKANAADAIIFGAVGGPKWDKVPYDVRPEAGLLRLRKDLGLFANIRPAICYPALADSSSLKREIVDGLDIIILRELTGGVYFGEPKTITDLGNGQKRAVDTQVYDTYEIERISRVAFELARKRRNKVTSMEKRNVMKTGVLWNEVVTQTLPGDRGGDAGRGELRRARRLQPAGADDAQPARGIPPVRAARYGHGAFLGAAHRRADLRTDRRGAPQSGALHALPRPSLARH